MLYVRSGGLFVQFVHFLGFPFLPLLHGFLPVCLLSRLDGLLLAFGSVALTVALSLRLHVGDGAVVQYEDGSTLNGV